MLANKKDSSRGDGGDAPLKLPASVLYVQHAQGLGGSAVSLRYLVDSMREAGVDCTVALARPSQELVDYYASARIRTIPIAGLTCWHHSTVAYRSVWNPRHVRELCGVAASWRSARELTLQLVDRVKPDLIHLNSMPLSASASALTAHSIPFVWHVREPPPHQGPRTAIIRSLMLAAPAAVFITDHDRELWVGAANGVTVPNAVPDAWFTPRSQRATCSEDEVRFAYLGGLQIQAKGAKTLLAALRALRVTGRTWRCVMPGSIRGERDWSYRNPLGRLARAAGLAGRSERLENQFRQLSRTVRLLPPIHRIRPVLQSVDFVVFPAVAPHFPRPVLEAAALGLPSVGSDVGGVRECLLHRTTGLLCAPGDPMALAAALGEMIQDPEFRKASGLRAQERARNLYTLSAQHRAISRIYQQVLAK